MKPEHLLTIAGTIIFTAVVLIITAIYGFSILIERRKAEAQEHELFI